MEEKKMKRGSQKNGEVKTHRIKISLTDQEYVKLMEICQLTKAKKSVYARETLMDSINDIHKKLFNYEDEPYDDYTYDDEDDESEDDFLN